MLATVQSLYPDHEVPELASFEGTLLRGPADYAAFLRGRSLHVVVAFPLSLDDLAAQFSQIWHSPAASSAPPPETTAALHDYLLRSDICEPTLVDAPAPGTPSGAAKAGQRNAVFSLQPPRLTFCPPRAMEISITFNNASLSPTVDLNTSPLAKQVTSLARNYMADPMNPSEDYFTEMRENMIAPLLQDMDRSKHPPWSPFGLYTHSKPRADEERSRDGTNAKQYRILRGTVLPTSVWEVIAQTRPNQHVCSVTRQVKATPTGDNDTSHIVDVVSGRATDHMSWAVSGPTDHGQYQSSEKIFYANFTSDRKLHPDAKRDRWWMADPPRLPTGFLGDAGSRTILAYNLEEVETFFRTFLWRCGFRDYEISVKIFDLRDIDVSQC